MIPVPKVITPAIVAFGLLLGSIPAQADPIVPSRQVIPSVAVQQIDLFGGNAFNPGASTITFMLTAVGSFTLDLAQQVGTTIDATIPAASFQGSFLGIPFDLLAGGPGLNPSTGQITNVVQNPADPGFPSGNPSSFVSGDFSIDTFFKLVLPSPFGPLTIVSDPARAAVFTATLHSLPVAPGTVFASPDRIDLFFLDPVDGPVRIGQSYDRTVTALPEPSAAALLGLGAVALLVRRRTRSA